MGYELVDGQGNFGSIDGDNAAAMRYTEFRMTKLSSEMFKDLEKEIVEWDVNFDEIFFELSVLALAVLILIVKGSEGIAVGMATKILSHNLSEIIDGLVALIDDESIGTEVLMQHIKGLEFLTVGLILGMDGLKKAYETG
jgi:Type IIA topoisomerase (DNA gyrase/topo II, topoisomerase IV), A subunit